MNIYHPASFTGKIVTSRCLQPATTEALVKVFRHNQSLLHEIIVSQTMTRKAWYSLYTVTPRPEQALASLLVTLPLDSDQVGYVVRTEPRAKPLITLLKHNILTRDQQVELVAAKNCSFRVADTFVTRTWAAPDLKRYVAESGAAETMIAWLAATESDQLSDSEVVKYLSALPATSPESQRWHHHLGEILERRPALAGDFVSSPSRVLRVAAAASRRIDTEELQIKLSGLDSEFDPSWVRYNRAQLIQLARNPIVSAEICERVTKRMHRWFTKKDVVIHAFEKRKHQTFVKAGVPYELLSDTAQIDTVVRLGNVWDAVALSRNLHLLPYQREAINQTLTRSNVDSTLVTAALVATTSSQTLRKRPPSTGNSRLRHITVDSGWASTWSPSRPPLGDDQDALARYCELHLGSDESRWQLFATLGDGFNGSLEDLLKSCQLLASQPSAPQA